MRFLRKNYGKTILGKMIKNSFALNRFAFIGSSF